MLKINIKGKEFNNPIDLSLKVIGGKWKIPIIWMLKDGVKRYGELRRSLPKVTHKMLTQQLRELESDEIISRKVFPEVPPKVEYNLTFLGQSVIPIIDLLKEWAEQYRSVFTNSRISLIRRTKSFHQRLYFTFKFSLLDRMVIFQIIILILIG